MAKPVDPTMRINPMFKKAVEDMQKGRINMKKDSMLKPAKPARITLAMTRHPEFAKIKKDIITADLP